MIVVRAALWAAYVVMAIALLGAVANVAAALFNTQTELTFAVEPFWPTFPKGTHIEGPTAHLDDGGLTSATALLSGLSTTVKVCWAISQALRWLLPATLALLVTIMCRSLLRGSAFAPAVARVMLGAAVVVVIGGTAMAVLGDMAGGMAAQQLLDYDFSKVPHAGAIDWMEDMWPKAAFDVTIPVWPIGAGLGLAALSAVFRYGSRLERDTAGLV